MLFSSELSKFVFDCLCTSCTAEELRTMILEERRTDRDVQHNMMTVYSFSRHAPEIVWVLRCFAFDSAKCWWDFVTCFEVPLRFNALFSNLFAMESSRGTRPAGPKTPAPRSVFREL